jgi:Zn-dependent oligopeptidase
MQAGSVALHQTMLCTPSTTQPNAALPLQSDTIPSASAFTPQDIMSTDALRAAVEAVTPALVNFRLRLGQSKPIYSALNTLKSDSNLWVQLSPEQQRLVSKTLTEMASNGVGLDAAKRATFNEIKNKLEQLQNQFSNNVLDAKGVCGVQESVQLLTACC